MIPPAPRRAVPYALLVVIAVLVAGCAKAEKDAGSFAALPPERPVLKEYRGAQVYLLRQADDQLVVFWGISPLGGGERGTVRCFVQDRLDRSFRGEERPFIDPCRGAWWASDGRFLGYTDDPADAPSSGPPLVQIPAEVRDGRVVLDDDYLTCLQNRRTDCDSRH
jgi:hypothetical protein